MIPPKKHRATVVSTARMSSKVYVARFRVEDVSFSFAAGQYGSFILAPTVRRNLSFATPPNGAEFEICADVTPMGPASKWLVATKPGDIIEFIGPLGKFTVSRDSPRKKIFVATGTGIGPVRSQVLDELRRSKDEPMWLYWGLRFEDDVFWNQEFLGLAKEHLNFHYTLTLSKPTIAWKGVDGRVTDHLFDQVEALANFDFYLCGSREMVSDVTNHLIEKNVPTEQIKTELFY